MTDYGYGDHNPHDGQVDRSRTYKGGSQVTGKKPREKHGESETEIIVAGDDAVILTDGGVPSLVGNTGASEETDIEVDTTTGYRLQTDLMSRQQAREIHRQLVEAGLDADKLAIVEEEIEVDSR